MKFLDDLLRGTEVGWLPLGEVTRYEQPTKYLVKSNDYKNSFPTPVLTAGKTFILGYTDETTGIYPASASPVIIFDDFTTANKWVDFDFKAKSSAMKMITSSDESRYMLKYIYHWLNTLPQKPDEADHKRRWISEFSNLLVPIPCPGDPARSVEIQRTLVETIDKFAELEAELEAELDRRRRQYAYYRDRLFSFSKLNGGG